MKYVDSYMHQSTKVHITSLYIIFRGAHSEHSPRLLAAPPLQENLENHPARDSRNRRALRNTTSKLIQRGVCGIPEDSIRDPFYDLLEFILVSQRFYLWILPLASRRSSGIPKGSILGISLAFNSRSSILYS